MILKEIYKQYGQDIDDDNQGDAFVLAHIARLYWYTINKKEIGNIHYKIPQREVVDNYIKKQKESEEKFNKSKKNL